MAERDPADKTRKFAQEVVKLKDREKRQPEGTDGDYSGAANVYEYSKPEPMTPEQAAYIKNMEQEQQDRRVRDIVTKPFHMADNWAQRKGEELSKGISQATKDKVNAVAHRYAQFIDPNNLRNPVVTPEPVHLGDVRVGSDLTGSENWSAGSLAQPQGTELHWEGLKQAAPTKNQGASFSGPTPKFSSEPSGMGGTAKGAPRTPARAMTDKELSDYADKLKAAQDVQHEALLGAGPATGDRDANGTVLPEWMKQYKREE